MVATTKKVVRKRDTRIEDFDASKIKKRLKVLEGRSPFDPKNIDYEAISKKALEQLPDDVTTMDVDTFIMEQSASMVTIHPDYSYLASAIAVSALHKETGFDFLEKTLKLESILNNEYVNFVKNNHEEIQNRIIYARDYDFDYFGLTTLTKSYLLKDPKGKSVESPQDLIMRVSLAISKFDLEYAFKVYDNMLKYYTHATPTLFNAGTKKQQLSSCFLLQIEDDSIEGIYNTLKECALISQSAGGIGLSINNVRAKGSYIKGTGGFSNGTVPMLRNFNETARYVDQGGGKRKGSIAVYMEPWHGDIEDFLELKKNHGKEEMRTRDLFPALWIPDAFMRQVESDGDWYLMCPNECAGLNDVYGKEFDELYWDYVEKGSFKKKLKARELWNRILVSQIETGTPYMLYKDASNSKSNQKNLGVIRSSNLCLSYENVIDIYHNGNYKKIPIGEIISLEGDIFVKSFNVPLFQIEYKKVLAKAMTNPSIKTVTITDTETNKSVKCTEDHEIYTERGYIKAKDLKQTDKLFTLLEYDSILTDKKGLEISYNEEEAPVYDITVEDTHNFFANDILVHNCSEIIEYTAPNEIAVCNLASIALPSFVNKEKRTFDYDKLWQVSYEITVNLNNVIDINHYPVSKSEYSNLKHRPIGIGVQGLADVFALLKVSFDSEDGKSASKEAKMLNKHIFAVIYHASITASHDLAMKHGSYQTFEGSPASKGLLQFDLWEKEPDYLIDSFGETPLYLDWNELKEKAKRGIRNSLLVAKMPTASTSQIMGYNECFEPYTSNIYSRRVLSGDFVVANKHLILELEELGLWDKRMKNRLIAEDGSVQNIEEIPLGIRRRYKTAYELSQKVIIELASDRGIYVCQSQSMNIFMKNPTTAKLSSMHMYGWKSGLKTGMYYLRSTSAVNAIKFTVDREEIENDKKSGGVIDEGIACSLDNPENCLMCGS